MKAKAVKLIPAILLLFLLCQAFLSCNKCDDMECFSPPGPFVFQLLDKDSGEDLIINNTYQISDVHIIAGFDNSKLVLESDSTASEVFFTSNDIGWQTGSAKKNYTLKLKDQGFNFIYHTESKNINCCSFTELQTIDFGSVNFSFNPAQNIYRVLL